MPNKDLEYASYKPETREFTLVSLRSLNCPLWHITLVPWKGSYIPDFRIIQLSNNISTLNAQLSVTSIECVRRGETADSMKVADAYRFALDLFRRGDAIANRLTLGRRCVRAWSDPRLAAQYKNYKWPGNVEKMDEYEQRYRQAVQASPPRVYVDNVGDAYAETVRIETAKWDLEHFNPRNTFRINLDRSVCLSSLL